MSNAFRNDHFVRRKTSFSNFTVPFPLVRSINPTEISRGIITNDAGTTTKRNHPRLLRVKSNLHFKENDTPGPKILLLSGIPRDPNTASPPLVFAHQHAPPSIFPRRHFVTVRREISPNIVPIVALARRRIPDSFQGRPLSPWNISSVKSTSGWFPL